MTIHCWNVRRLGKSSKSKLVKCSICESLCDIVCLQEIKLQTFNDKLLKSTCGNNFDSWYIKPSVGASDGLLTCWKSSTYTGVPFHKGDFSISTNFQKLDRNNQQFLVTNVYGPLHRQD